MGEYVKDKEKMNFKNLASLEPVFAIVHEAEIGIADQTRNANSKEVKENIKKIFDDMKNSGTDATISNIKGVGVAAFLATYKLSVVGLSAAGVSAGLLGVGALFGLVSIGGMIAIGAFPIYKLTKMLLDEKRLKEAKEKLYLQATMKLNGVKKALEGECSADSERLEYLGGLRVLLDSIIDELGKDLGE